MRHWLAAIVICGALVFGVGAASAQDGRNAPNPRGAAQSRCRFRRGFINYARSIFPLILIAILSACTIKYQMVGVFDDYNEVRARVTGNPPTIDVWLNGT